MADIKTHIVFLHGFTGSGEDWGEISGGIKDICTPVTIDLAGHGAGDHSSNPSDYTIKGQVDRIREILDVKKIRKIFLVGYSMGGRIALNFALKYQERLYGVVLESSTAGISDDAARADRLNQDETMAKFIEKEGVDKFVERWMNHPLFASRQNIAPELIKEIRRRKLKNSVGGLTRSLRAAGTGVMMPVWDRLNEIAIPVLLISGSLDEKFTEINRKMHLLIPSACHVVVEGAGHTTHLEKPRKYINLLRSFLEL